MAMTDVKAEEIREEGEGFFHKSLDILLKNKLTLAGMVIVAFIILLGLLAPLVSPWDPNFMNVAGRLQAPSLHHSSVPMKWDGTFSPVSFTAPVFPLP